MGLKWWVRRKHGMGVLGKVAAAKAVKGRRDDKKEKKKKPKRLKKRNEWNGLNRELSGSVLSLLLDRKPCSSLFGTDAYNMNIARPFFHDRTLVFRKAEHPGTP
jgi:uncharacterized protein involved in propanediol utilization